jgi:hypothetical protein
MLEPLLPPSAPPSWPAKLAIAVIKRAILDVQDVNASTASQAQARTFLVDGPDLRFWAECLGVDPRRLAGNVARFLAHRDRLSAHHAPRQAPAVQLTP